MKHQFQRPLIKTILLLFLLNVVFANAQNFKDVKISLDIKSGTLNQIFKAISVKTKLNFTYGGSIAENKTKYVATYKNKSLTDILEDLSKQAQFDFKVVNNEIMIATIDKKVSENTEAKQIQKLNGIVSDDLGQTLPGATITEKGTNNMVVTNLEGKFSIELSNSKAIITVSFVGLTTQEIEVGTKQKIAVKLKSEANLLEDVVVIGYGKVQSEKLTTAVTNIQLKDDSKQAVTSFEQVLIGKTPGVTINQSSGAPGGNISVRVRGMGSISNSHEPLYVIDGVPLDNDLRGSTGTNSALEQNTNPLSTINPQDIESVSILKDAAAASIYGSRAANGVVMITTKNGSSKEKGLKISFSKSLGVQSVLRKVGVLNAYEYAQLGVDGQNAQYIFNNPSASINDPNGIRTNPSWRIAPELYPYVAGVQGLTDTDWQDEIFRNAVISINNLAISGGVGDGNFYASINYLKQEGIVIGSKFERYTARLKFNSGTKKNIRFGINFSPAFTDSDLVSSEGPYFQNGIISGAQLYAPIFPVYNADGSFNFENNNWGFGHSSQINPLAIALLNKDRKQHFRLLGNSYLSVDFLKNFEYKVSLGGDVNFFKRDTFSPSTLESVDRVGPSFAFGRSRSELVTNYNIEHTLNYDKKVGKHRIDCLLGFSAQKNRTERNFVRGNGFPNDLVQTLNAASITDSGFSNVSEWSLLSYFSRLQYDYNAKYLFSASVRADGSSRFAPNNKWGYFPSTSLGWVVSKENFLKHFKAIKSLKIRASYGESGNFDIGNYAYLETLLGDNYVLGTGDGEIVTGLRPNNKGNDRLGWESKKMYNVGADGVLFSGALNFNFNYYTSINKDFLFEVPISAASGFSSVLENQGKIENKGFELTVGSDFKIGKLEVSVSGNISANKNKVLELGGGARRLPLEQGSVPGATYLTEVGKPLGSYFLYKTDGVFLNQLDVDNSPHLTDARPGDVKYIDVNGDGIIDPNDRTIVGSFFPDYNYGASLSLDYKGINLAINVAGSEGFEILNLHRRYSYNITGNFNQLQDAVGRWVSEDNIGNGYTVSAKTSTGRQSDISDRHVEDGSYFKIQNITLGYNFPKQLVSELKVKSARLFFSAQNPFVFSKYSGYNPEVSNRPDSAKSPGEDYGSYPLARTVSMGLDITF